ncbi:hypothetical protein LP420_26935 [Massilia sp. B-10]|nr:hypothetical protein LP420_26935 [Massilia sp. B-10]
MLRRRQILKGAIAGALPLAVPSLALAGAEPLVVGGLPVTCNLTLPIACVAKTAANACRLRAPPSNTVNTAAGRRSRSRS